MIAATAPAITISRAGNKRANPKVSKLNDERSGSILGIFFLSRSVAVTFNTERCPCYERDLAIPLLVFAPDVLLAIRYLIT